ncbi:MAG: hypothetical protein IIU00_00610, partial [Clostridia bacterium]|nr:hypothetical protein [Clostridia bacterium]
MKKRLLACALITMLFTALSSVTVWAASQSPLAFDVQDVSQSCRADTIVEIPVTVTQNPGYLLGTVGVVWDEDILSLTDIRFTDAAPDCMTPVNYPVSDGMYYISFGNPAAAQDFTATGTFFTLIFRVTQDVQPGEFTVNIIDDVSGIFNSAMEPVPLSCCEGTVTLSDGPVITAQPQNASGAAGDKVSFPLTAEGNGLTYQWQLSDDQGKSWRDSSTKTATYTTTLSEKNNGRYVRCVVTDQNGASVTSEAASMKMITALAITEQPSPVTAKSGDLVTFKVTATGDGLTYQWQLSDDQGKTWRNSKATTASYSTTLSTNNSGRYLRCIVSDQYGSSKKSNATYMKITSLKITGQPSPVTAKSGDLVTFNVAASGPGITYQWQLSDDQGKTWRDSSNKTAEYATTLSDKNNGRYVRCIVTDKYGNTKYSAAGAMKLMVITITTQPANQTVKNGATASFKVVATG